MEAFNLDKFSKKTITLTHTVLAMASPAEAAFLCVAVAAHIVAMTTPVEKHGKLVEMLQQQLGHLTGAIYRGSVGHDALH